MPDKIIEEYQHCSRNLRHYGNMRFAEITLFAVFSASLVQFVFGEDPPPHHFATPLKWVGIVISVLFYVMNERRVLLWKSLYTRACELEGSLGFRQYSVRPKNGIFSNRNAARGFYVLVAVMWLVTLVSP